MTTYENHMIINTLYIFYTYLQYVTDIETGDGIKQKSVSSGLGKLQK